MTASSSKPPNATPHRPEIDGLRSIAVLAVVFYHFGVTGFGGGFVGVDIFFVISGFLIGSILWKELQEIGKISLSRFYLRRIRRLAPAYFVMTVVALGVGWFVLMPFEFRELGKGVIAATVYLSNVLFFRQAGYFDGSAEEKVLLHTWSLSVEEQFYLVFPALLLLLARWPKVLVPALWGIAAVSLVSAIYLTTRHQPAAFYLFPFRAWELLAGVLLAMTSVGKQRRGPWVSWSGLVLVIGSVIAIRPEYGFPGWQAIFPVLGTVLLIMGGRDENVVNRALSSKGPVLIGLVSYSLYLWHWPVFVFATYAFGPIETLIEKTGWIALSIGLAALSWRFVEQPVRLSAAITPRILVGATAVASCAALGIGALLYKTEGMPARFSDDVRVHIDASADFIQDWSRCITPQAGAWQGIETCAIGPEGPPELLIWGDSHLRAYQDGLAQLALEKNVPALIVWRAGCPPFFGVSKTESAATSAQDEACKLANAQIETAIEGWHDLKSVVLIGRWTYYATGQGFGIDAHNHIQLHQDYDALAQQTVETLQNRDVAVFVVQQVPEFTRYDSRRVARDLSYGGLTPEQAADAAAEPRTEVEARQRQVTQHWTRLKDRGLVQPIPTWPEMCDATTCYAIHDGTGQYFDNNHVTNAAAKRLRHVFAPAFDLGQKGDKP
ncbi:acyltransferase family protein [Shimia thalassica]|uniref:acyltransferase family protein n=1 Tax=Shimia thalassica TaxID=1715693 RepID=UPI0026E458D9|nr:acyltransferase family protein [Shimia thalassica]MDO6479813.1 acyltransferase family protein [Shimia thalassica]